MLRKRLAVHFALPIHGLFWQGGIASLVVHLCVAMFRGVHFGVVGGGVAGGAVRAAASALRVAA
eukprot:7931816-Prorocentrum_lima.AAC.1